MTMEGRRVWHVVAKGRGGVKIAGEAWYNYWVTLRNTRSDYWRQCEAGLAVVEQSGEWDWRTGALQRRSFKISGACASCKSADQLTIAVVIRLTRKIDDIFIHDTYGIVRTNIILIGLLKSRLLHCEAKTAPFSFCNNFVKFYCIEIIAGTRILQ